MPAKKLTRDDVRIEPIHVNVYDGAYVIGEVFSAGRGAWKWWHVQGDGPSFTRTREAAIRAVIRAENARRKGS